MVAWCYSMQKMNLNSLHSFLTALCFVQFAQARNLCAVLQGCWILDEDRYCGPAGFEYLGPFPSVQLILKKALKANKTGEGGYSLLVWGCKGLTAA